MALPVSDTVSRLHATAARFVEEQRIAGAAVGVVHGDELVWSAGVGYADRAAHREASPATLYRIASITKTFTGTAILQLRDEGKLHLDDPAVTHLPELSAAGAPFGPIEGVTLRRMLSHESGLASEPPGTDWATHEYEPSAARNLERASETGTRIPANRQWKYSNLAYQLLGEIVARVSGRPYGDYIRAEILDPLGMGATSFEPLSPALAERSATPYDARFLSDELVPSRPFSSIGAEGGLWSCVEDLALWASFQLREDGGPRSGGQVLSGASLAEMHAARYLTDAAWTSAWGIAWYSIRRGDVIWVQHSGGLPGFVTDVCFDPKRRVGAIALLNGDADAPGLAMDLATIARDAIVAAAPDIGIPPVMPEAYAPLLGLYLDRQQAAIVRVEWRDGKLTLSTEKDAEWKPTLAPTDEADVFLIEPGFRESGETARFQRRADGRVVSLYTGDQTVLRLDPVE
jgi:CubicO group peptidase (beta-lactamase class C family)